MVQNVFALRTSEHSSSDEEFAQSFAADALQVLPEAAFKPGALVLRSAPGGGKTSLLRMFTPGPLAQTIRNRSRPPFDEIHAKLEQVRAVSGAAPRLLGVYVSSNGGYAEIGPPLDDVTASGLFRSLLNARIVLRTLRALARHFEMDYENKAFLTDLKVSVESTLRENGHIPLQRSGAQLRKWAELTETACLSYLDTASPSTTPAELPLHISVDAIQWLASAKFSLGGSPVPLSPLLMFDDVQRLRPWQRSILFAECLEHRTSLPVWIAEQTKVLDPSDVLTASRSERDYLVVQLEKAWADNKSRFQRFAMAIADRRLRQAGIELPLQSLLSEDLSVRELAPTLAEAVSTLRAEIASTDDQEGRFEGLLSGVDEEDHSDALQHALALGRLRIHIARERNKRPLTVGADSPDGILSSTSNLAAASIRFVSSEFHLPYFYGIDRITQLASFNIEEFLQICAALFDLIYAASIVRTGGPAVVSARDQDDAVRQIAKRRFNELSRTVRYGEMAQRLVEAVGVMARERTFLPNAPYAPGVTGFAISGDDRIQLSEAVKGKGSTIYSDLAQVLTACVGQNVFDIREQRRDERLVTVFYLNRMLCAHFGLVYQYGGWQRVKLQDLMAWSRGLKRASDRTRFL